MILGILSDTHDEWRRTRRAVAALRAAGAEALVHCGDFVAADLLRELAGLPSWFVFGNNDSDSAPELRRVAAETGAVCLEWGGTFDAGGKRVAVTHGHMDSDRRRVLLSRPDYYLFGHTHAAEDSDRFGVRGINPGALCRADEYTVAVLDAETGELRLLRVE